MSLSQIAKTTVIEATKTTIKASATYGIVAGVSYAANNINSFFNNKEKFEETARQRDFYTYFPCRLATSI